jgi:hypothetical protein
MTEAERAFEAWWATETRAHSGIVRGLTKGFARLTFLAGWRRERPRAKPLGEEKA